MRSACIVASTSENSLGNACTKAGVSGKDSYMSKRINIVKKAVTIFLAIAVVLSSTVVVNAATTNSQEGYSVPAEVTIHVGETKTIRLSEPDDQFTDVGFSYDWYNVTEVSASYGSYWGKTAEITFTGAHEGTSELVARVDRYTSRHGEGGKHLGAITLTTKINVVGESQNVVDEPQTVALQSISLSKTSMSLVKGNSSVLNVSYNPSNTTDSKTVTWSSSNSSVAAVSNGVVTAKGAGTATITATCNGKKATCLVTVSVPLQSISLSKTSLSLNKGSSSTLTVSYNPSNTTVSKTVTWSSSNSSVASVSGGRVTAKAAGTATITATCNGKQATCKVTVKSIAGYQSVTEAYTLLNSFRTTKSVWQWNSNNKTKTYFNKKGCTTLKSLTRSTALENTAKVRAKELATKFSHTRPNGKSCFTAYPSGLKYKGENIAMGQTTAKEVTNDWQETNCKYSGQGHRRNMLNKNYTKVGIACYRADNGTLYWVQCFGN